MQMVQLWRTRAAIDRWAKRFLQKLRKETTVWQSRVMTVETEPSAEVYKLFK